MSSSNQVLSNVVALLESLERQGGLASDQRAKLAQIREKLVPSSATSKAPVAQSPPAPTGREDVYAATRAELERDFGDDPAFVSEALSKRYTMAAAFKVNGLRLKAHNDRMRADLHTRGIQVGNNGVAAGGENGIYMRTVRARAMADGVSFFEAIRRVNQDYPQLRAAYISDGTRGVR